jgi:hypothetical protein
MAFGDFFISAFLPFPLSKDLPLSLKNAGDDSFSFLRIQIEKPDPHLPAGAFPSEPHIGVDHLAKNVDTDKGKARQKEIGLQKLSHAQGILQLHFHASSAQIDPFPVLHLRLPLSFTGHMGDELVEFVVHLHEEIQKTRVQGRRPAIHIGIEIFKFEAFPFEGLPLRPLGFFPLVVCVGEPVKSHLEEKALSDKDPPLRVLPATLLLFDHGNPLL